MMSSAIQKKLAVLLLCDKPPRVADTLYAHINALEKLSGNRVFVAGVFGGSSGKLDFDRFDVILIHYSLVVSNDNYVSPQMRKALRASRALKGVFIQDEYRHINKTIEAFRDIGIDMLFTCVPDESIATVYSEALLPHVRKINVLTGYVPESLLSRPIKPYAERTIDIGYRARKVPAWLGDLGQEKWNIGRRFLSDAKQHGLICDIAYREEERLYGEDWNRFLQNCKATLGVESGSSVFDFSGEVQAAVDRDVAIDPSVSYQELKQRHFADIDGAIDQRQISPRCFEAAALGTLMILYEGGYSGRLVPWRHFVPLAKDHSNMAEVVAVLRDNKRAEEIIQNAYLEVARNPRNHYAEHVNCVDRIIAEEHAASGKDQAVPYSADEFMTMSEVSTQGWRRQVTRTIFTYSHYLIFRVLLGAFPERHRDILARHLGAIFQAMMARVRHFFSPHQAKTDRHV